MPTGKYRDRVSIRRDTANAGDELPTYTEVFRGVPCNIIHTSGDESFRGRQMEGRTDYVVEVPFDMALSGDLVPSSVLMVEDSSGFVGGEILNIAHVQIKRKPGMPHEFWVYCRELTT